MAGDVGGAPVVARIRAQLEGAAVQIADLELRLAGSRLCPIARPRITTTVATCARAGDPAVLRVYRSPD